MICNHRREQAGKRTPSNLLVLALCVGMMLVSLLRADEHEEERACSQTAQAAFKAMVNQALADYWVVVGNSHNHADSDLRAQGLEEADEVLQETLSLAQAQLAARLRVCDALGEAPYAPEVEPEQFVDFDAVSEGRTTFTANPFFPLVPGLTLEYLVSEGDGSVVERILVEVLDETKEILDIHCRVVRDRVWEIDEEGAETLIEDTLDWYAQDKSGNVWYFGEIVLNFEDGELDNLDGSWRTGKDQAQAGYLMLAQPQAGDLYRQEFYFTEAEDMAEVVSLGESDVTVPAGRFQENILKTRDWTPIEPDVEEFKYYAAGIGMILEEKPSTGERVELINVVRPQ